MRVRVEEDMPEGDSGSVLPGAFTRPAEARTGLPDGASPLRPFYRTTALPCPYVEHRRERKLITEISGADSLRFYSELSRAGFRRSHHLAYRPACAGCTACVPVRVAARDFVPARSARRIIALNSDLETGLVPARAAAEQYRLFTRYQRSRHADSDMASMTYGDYRAMVEDSPVETVLAEFRGADHRLVSACLLDVLDDGLSAVYSFFDPAEPKRSLGTFMILALIQEARRLNLPYVYLGYWVGESAKMAYKTRFRPLEALGPKGWAPLTL